MILAIIDFFKSLWNKLTGHKDTVATPETPSAPPVGGGSRVSDTNTDQV